MLSKSQKEEIIQSLKEKLETSKIVVVADYQGMTVKDMDDIKKEIREIGGEFQVTKKTLMNIALKEKDIDLDTKQYMGQLAFAFGPEETGVPKKIWSFIKKNEKMKIEAGVLENKAIDASAVESLAKLPSREELLGKVVGTIAAPMGGIVNVLTGPMRGLLNVLRT